MTGRTFATLILTLVACLRPAIGQTPAGAVQAALADVQTLPPAVRTSQFYLWNPSRSEDVATAVTFTLNAAVSRSNVNVVPTAVAGGELIRCDLTTLAPDDNDFQRLAQNLSDLASLDPYFHVQQPVIIDVPKFRHANGKFYTRKTVIAGVIAPHLGEAGLALTVPIYRADWFIAKALSAVDGGFYYRFIGIDAGVTQTQYLLSRGASEQQVDALRSDERAAMTRSGVTAKPRRIDVFRGAGVRPSAGTGLISVTHDIFDGDVQAERNPFRNLLNFTDRGREIILEKSNGWHEFTLWDAAGKLVDSAPDKLARDSKVPEPHTNRLQPAIGCIRCHGPHEGWQPFQNHVQVLLSRRLDVFDDLSSRDSVPDTLRRLSGLYSGNLAEPLRLGRNTYSDVIWQATLKSVPDASAAVANVYGTLIYDLVTPQVAVAELGMKAANEDEAIAILYRALGVFPPDANGISPEDPIFGLLEAGIGVNRDVWETVFADAITRVQATRDAQSMPQPREK